MKVEREIAGFALPFAAGVLLASLQNMVPYHILSAVTMALCTCGAGFLVHCSCGAGFMNLCSYGDGPMAPLSARTAPFHKTRPILTVIIICLLALCCGIFCFSNASLIAIGDSGPFGSVTSTHPVGADTLTYPSLQSPRMFAERCCFRLQHLIDSMPFRREETAAVIKALLTGEKTDIPADIRTAFRESGASHILALSGMHLGIIYGIINKGLSIIGNRPKAKFIRALLTVMTCGFYTLSVGAGESIVRAFIFITINEATGLALRYRSLKQTLLLALMTQSCCSPLSISSVSFQLSYAAMAGIAFIHPWLKSFWPDDSDTKSPSSIKDIIGTKGILSIWKTVGTKGTLSIWNIVGIKGIFRKLWDSASMSISCQITSAPIAWHYFRTFPTNFILTNLIAIPLTCLIIPVSILCTILYSVGICPNMILNLTEELVHGLIWSLSVIASM